ncbi:arsenate reductase/protein-tyrosine-phosphatase family protein [Pararhodobacter sp.]|uniref:arsenate reductase/protein-tyrosine-phosphatase family protein n=1 Tax=Pararhodobacter sp. TaxID=2127056 RepID=UPI002FDC9F6E
MEKEIAQLSALAHPQRLAIFRLLMRRYPDRLPAGEIGAVLALRPSTLSAYLSALQGAALITQERQGTSLRYSVALDASGALMSFLFHDCCRDRADPGIQGRSGGRNGGRIRNVLFLCSGNSARSLIAEAILRDLAGDRFEVFSAGTEARGTPYTPALDLLRAKGHDTGCLWSKPVDDLRGEDAPQMDFVFSVCDRAANVDLAPWPGHPVQGHWAVPDPVTLQSTEAVAESYQSLHRRISAFAALPDDLSRPSLQRRIDDIARLPLSLT